MNLLVFAGTTEGTDFTQKALSAGHTVTVSVATDYGADVLKANLSSSPELTAIREKKLHILHGRLSAEEIASLAVPFDAIVDATHPFAEEVTKNLLAASRTASVPYFRLLRPPVSVRYEKLREFKTIPELTHALCDTTGNVFLSTGSRDLDAFAAIPNYTERLFVRVLPSAESIEKCRAIGFAQSHIIAMQGAFSVELNKSLFSEYHCRILVTKESGSAGGFAEKIAAAQALDMEVFALLPPQEPKLGIRTFSTAEDMLSALSGVK
ncbi:MAG: precorrin-6A reductase [Treponema sp.]|nr:precorrin-6A reductase [Treponema sp.]